MSNELDLAFLKTTGTVIYILRGLVWSSPCPNVAVETINPKTRFVLLRRVK